MPDYYYVCANRDAQFFQGACMASDEEELNGILTRRGLYMLWSEERLREDPEERAITRLILKPIALEDVVQLLIRRSHGYRALSNSHWSRGVPFATALDSIPGLAPGPEVPERAPELVPESGPEPVPEPAAAKPVRQLNKRVIGSWAAIVVAVALFLGPPVQRCITRAFARHRYRKAVSSMRAIAAAAQQAQASIHQYAPAAMPGVLPDGFGAFLPAWPTPPCRGWSYSWDHWTVLGDDPPVRITLRDAHLYAVYYRCVDAEKCDAKTMWDHGEAIEQAAHPELYCDRSASDDPHASRHRREPPRAL